MKWPGPPCNPTMRIPVHFIFTYWMKYAIGLILLLPITTRAQFADDFTDGDFTANPTWSGDTPKFEVDAVLQLHLNAPAVADVAYLSTPSGAIHNAEWTFWLHMDFNPSSSNYADIILVSDQNNPGNPFNGYFVRCGGTNDEVALFRKNGSTSTKIIDGADGTLNSASVNVRVRVTRDALGNWELFSDPTGSTNYVSEGTATDNTWTQSTYLAVHCTYTATRSTLFWFDDFVVTAQPVVDTVKPVVTSLAVLSNTQLDLRFSELVDTVSGKAASNYFVDNGVGNPSSAQLDATDSALVHLTLGSPFVNGVEYALMVSGVSDRAANVMDPDTLPFTYYIAQHLDVMINEVMADPSPVVGLPDAEFVELFNTRGFDISLEGWTFSDASTTVGIPDIIIPADSFLILCANADTALFQPFGVVAGVSLPSLNNTGDDLTLKDSIGLVIHSVSYTDAWYRDDLKRDGGWSLEMIDTGSLCGGASNWIASADSTGGTPGRKNSLSGILVDTTAPKIVSVTVLSVASVQLTFDEPIDTTEAAIPSNYDVDNGVGQPLLAVPQAPDYLSVVLQLASPVDTGALYTVTTSVLSDCAGNSGSSSGIFIIPYPIDSGDILISEILFNPRSGGVDFLELYNRSGEILDLSGVEVVELDTAGSIEDSATYLTQLLFHPGSYVALTSDPDIIRSYYTTPNPDSVILLSDLPNWPDDAGIVRIQLDSNHVVDDLRYSDEWHFALIDIVDGVSLERLRFDSPTNDPDNWFSAASTVGYATPAYRNSHFNEGLLTSGEVTLDYEVFSPDQDGFKDVLIINYQFSEPGAVGNVIIFDSDGRPVRHLVRNELLSSGGFFTWDGLGDDDYKVRMGIYVVWFEVFALSGQVHHFKVKCVVGGRL